MVPRPRRRAIAIAVNSVESQVSWVGTTGRCQRSLCGDLYRCCSNKYISSTTTIVVTLNRPTAKAGSMPRETASGWGRRPEWLPDPCRSACLLFPARFPHRAYGRRARAGEAAVLCRSPLLQRRQVIPRSTGSKRTWLSRNCSITLPVGPFRCLATISSAIPRGYGWPGWVWPHSSSVTYMSSR